jgi:hypothetical protein
MKMGGGLPQQLLLLALLLVSAAAPQVRILFHSRLFSCPSCLL